MTAPAVTPSAPAEGTSPTPAAPSTPSGDGGAAPSPAPSAPATPSAPSGPSLGDAIGAMLGTEPGVADALGLSTAPAEAEAPKPETPAEPAAPAPEAPTPDPLAGAQPFTYGDGKTLEGIHVIPGEGALIPEDQLHVLRSLAEQRDALDQSSQQYASEIQHYEDLTGFVIAGPDGKEQRVTGAQGVAEMRVQIARHFAENEALRAVLSDPNKLLALIARDGDKFVLNEDALEALSLRIDVAARQGEDAVRKAMQPYVQQRGAAPRPAQPRSAAPDTQAIASQAPALIDAAAKQVGADAKTLTDADRKVLAQQLPRYVRTVTEQDRRFNPSLKLGAPIVDTEFTQVVQDRVKLRQEIATTAAANAKAAAENAARTAAANAGRPNAAPPAAPAAPAKPKDPDYLNWRMREAAAMGKRYDPETDKIV